jgi:phosphosulfolactate synthase (CoM biosynthesis protein A)
MLSLKKLSEMASIEEKGIFPYKILNKKLKEYVKINNKMFNTYKEYLSFINNYGKNVNIFNILEEYCKNDALITKKAIIKY